ncbi:MAG: hypothetical protein QOI83_1537 [Streptomycetaceae bacterium]|jgi:hypothetical protein|nr:hypothetical protein [Streptomycetaceae bacterium]
MDALQLPWKRTDARSWTGLSLPSLVASWSVESAVRLLPNLCFLSHADTGPIEDEYTPR